MTAHRKCQTCTRSSSSNSRLFQVIQKGKRSIWGRQSKCISNSACRHAALEMNRNLPLRPMFLLSLYQTGGRKWRTGSSTDKRNNNEWKDGRNKDAMKQGVEKFYKKRRQLQIYKWQRGKRVKREFKHYVGKDWQVILFQLSWIHCISKERNGTKR